MAATESLDTESLAADPVVEEIMERYHRQHGAMIPMLQDIQAKFDYLPREQLRYLARRLGVPLSQVYSVATFYKSFSLAPRGQHLLTLCLGTVCYLKGADKLHQMIQETLEVEPGGTSPDRRFTYQPVNCLGACALAPVLVIDGKYFEKVTPDELPRILSEYEKGEA